MQTLKPPIIPSWISCRPFSSLRQKKLKAINCVDSKVNKIIYFIMLALPNFAFLFSMYEQLCCCEQENKVFLSALSSPLKPEIYSWAWDSYICVHEWQKMKPSFAPTYFAQNTTAINTERGSFSAAAFCERFDPSPQPPCSPMSFYQSCVCLGF